MSDLLSKLEEAIAETEQISIKAKVHWSDRCWRRRDDALAEDYEIEVES